LRIHRLPRRVHFAGGTAGGPGFPPMLLPVSAPPPPTCSRGPDCPPHLPAGTRFCTGCGRTRLPPDVSAGSPLAWCTSCLAPLHASSLFCGRCGRSSGPSPACRKRSWGDLGQHDGEFEFDGSSPSSRSPSFLPSTLFRSFCMLHVAVWSLSFVPIALFGLFLPGRSCVPAAGPITGSRSAEWSIFHQAFADAEVISVGLRLADWHAFGHQARSAESAWSVVCGH
jgi:hypothetical protein